MKTKVVATLGMKTGSAEMIKAMVEAGMDIARVTKKCYFLPRKGYSLQDHPGLVVEYGII